MPNEQNDTKEQKACIFEFTPEAAERLQEIKQLAGASTYAEVARNAIRLYEWFLQQKRDGYKFLLVKEDEVKEIEVNVYHDTKEVEIIF